MPQAPDARLALARLVGRGAGAVSRLAGKGGGTAISGVVAEKIEPRLRRRVFADRGVTLLAVCGSNGKTTTSGLAAAG